MFYSQCVPILTHNQCGLNGALYFVSMDADGGMSKYSGNQAGAEYGTGYCDSQCPRDLKFIGGQVSSLFSFPLPISIARLAQSWRRVWRRVWHLDGVHEPPFFA